MRDYPVIVCNTWLVIIWQESSHNYTQWTLSTISTISVQKTQLEPLIKYASLVSYFKGLFSSSHQNFHHFINTFNIFWFLMNNFVMINLPRVIIRCEDVAKRAMNFDCFQKIFQRLQTKNELVFINSDHFQFLNVIFSVSLC